MVCVNCMGHLLDVDTCMPDNGQGGTRFHHMPKLLSVGKLLHLYQCNDCCYPFWIQHDIQSCVSCWCTSYHAHASHLHGRSVEHHSLWRRWRTAGAFQFCRRGLFPSGICVMRSVFYCSPTLSCHSVTCSCCWLWVLQTCYLFCTEIVFN